MGTIGRVESLWRYPVKSMGGDEVEQVFFGFSGVYGDRLFALTSSACPEVFPYLTGREKSAMLCYRPRFRSPEKALEPPHLAEAESLACGITPPPADGADLVVDVETPSGESFAIDDPNLIRDIAQGMGEQHQLGLLRSDRALTDCRPISLCSLQTIGQLGRELGGTLDKRRFRANLYLDLDSGKGFEEDRLVGRSVQIGSKAVVRILERDPRCKMINLDPETGESSSSVLRRVAQDHDSMTGVYGAVLVEGTVHRGDAVEVLD